MVSVNRLLNKILKIGLNLMVCSFQCNDCWKLGVKRVPDLAKFKCAFEHSLTLVLLP